MYLGREEIHVHSHGLELPDDSFLNNRIEIFPFPHDVCYGVSIP